MLCHHLVSDHHSSIPQFCPTLPPIKALLSKTFDSKSRQQEKCEHAQSWPSKLSSEPESNCCSEIIVRNFSCYFLAPRRWCSSCAASCILKLCVGQKSSKLRINFFHFSGGQVIIPVFFWSNVRIYRNIPVIWIGGQVCLRRSSEDQISFHSRRCGHAQRTYSSNNRSGREWEYQGTFDTTRL